MIRRMFEPKVLSFTFIFLVFLCSLCGAQSSGKESSSAVQILESTKLVNIPDISYKVVVLQKITGAKSEGASLSEVTYMGSAQFTPSEGIERIESGENKTTEQISVPKVLVDLGTFIEEMLSYPALTVDTVEIDERPHYRIQGQSKEGTQECIIWVDSEYKSISQIQVYLMQKPFAKITVEYTKPLNGFWLPSVITLHHATDDSRVTLEFSEYEFAK